MKRLSILLIALCLVSITQAQTDKERYRRSSLCTIMLTHRDKKYAEEMERVFRAAKPMMDFMNAVIDDYE